MYINFSTSFQPELHHDSGSPGEPRGADGGNTLVASESMTKTTLDDLFDTLKKLEEEEQLATARPDKKNSWCMYHNLLCCFDKQTLFDH